MTAAYVNLDAMLEQFDKRASKVVGDKRVSVESMREFICNRPRANVKEIIYAHWIKDDDGVFICSNCGNAESSNGRYCSYCGAEMSEVK